MSHSASTETRVVAFSRNGSPSFLGPLFPVPPSCSQGASQINYLCARSCLRLCFLGAPKPKLSFLSSVPSCPVPTWPRLLSLLVCSPPLNVYSPPRSTSETHGVSLGLLRVRKSTFFHHTIPWELWLCTKVEGGSRDKRGAKDGREMFVVSKRS